MHAHRKGNLRPLSLVPVALSSSVPAAAIAVGELVGSASNVAVPAASWAWTTDEETTREAFVAAFLGVSSSRSRLASTDARDLAIEVATDGFFEVELSSATTVHIGTLLGPAKASGNALLNTCKTVTDGSEACFICTEEATSATRVMAKIINTVLDRISADA